MKLTLSKSLLAVLLLPLSCSAQLVVLTVVRLGSPVNNQIVNVLDNVVHVGVGENLLANLVNSTLTVGTDGIVEKDAQGKFIVLDAHTPCGQLAASQKHFTSVQGYLNYNNNPTFTAVPDTTNGGYSIHAGILTVPNSFPITILVSPVPQEFDNEALISDVAEEEAAVSLTTITSVFYSSEPPIFSSLLAPLSTTPSVSSSAPASEPVSLTAIPQVTAPSNLSLLNPQPTQTGVPAPSNSSAVGPPTNATSSVTLGPLINTTSATATPALVTGTPGFSAVAPVSAAPGSAGPTAPVVGSSSHILSSVRSIVVVLALSSGLLLIA